jgi:hypothetical protein
MHAGAPRHCVSQAQACTVKGANVTDGGTAKESYEEATASTPDEMSRAKAFDSRCPIGSFFERSNTGYAACTDDTQPRFHQGAK